MLPNSTPAAAACARSNSFAVPTTQPLVIITPALGIIRLQPVLGRLCKHQGKVFAVAILAAASTSAMAACTKVRANINGQWVDAYICCNAAGTRCWIRWQQE